MNMTMLLQFIVILPLLVNSQKIQQDQIAKTVYLNDTSFVLYNSSATKCRIDCADSETMSAADFRSFEKVWMISGTEMFSSDDKTFIDNNRSLEFQTLTMEDSGSYDCCVRSKNLAYQSYVCYNTQLTVLEDLPFDEVNSTSAPTTPPSWNVIVEEGSVLNCQPGNNYFVKMFEENTTDIKCLVNMVQVKIKTNNTFYEPLYNDLFIENFNVKEHSGIYVCNGTVEAGNDTFSEMISFTVSESLQENQNATLLDNLTVRIARRAASSLKTSAIIIFPMLFAFIVKHAT